jgi:long-chain fatty acid transport protein
MALLGQQLEVGLAVVLPKPSATFGGTDFDGGGLKAIPVPEFGYVRPLDDQQSVGLSVYGNGVATKHSQSISGGAGSANDGANLTQVIFSPTYALKLSPTQAVGVSLDLAYQRFRVNGVPDANGVEGQGYESSTGAGLKLGWTGEVLPGVSLGRCTPRASAWASSRPTAPCWPTAGSSTCPSATAWAWRCGPRPASPSRPT